MIELTNYINENIQPLDKYIINEGKITNWLKKFWNWLTDANEKNVKDNNGKYVIDKDTTDILKGKNNKSKYQIKSILCDKDPKNKNSFESLIKSLSKDDECSFKDAKKYFDNEKFDYVTCTTITLEEKSYIIAFMFYINESDENIKQTKTFFSDQFDDDDNFDDKIIRSIYTKSSSCITKETNCTVNRDR